MANVVKVTGISSQTSEKDIRDFFSFCGKISHLEITDSKAEAVATQEATVTFEKETAAKTALLLDSTQLGSAQIHVTSASSSGTTSAAEKATSDEHNQHDDVAQEDKPRSRIVAEYLAHGYVIGDKAIERAIALDQQHGVSSRFLSALNNFDAKYKVTDKGKAADEKYGVSARATTAFNGLYSYFDMAANTPTGQKLRAFYEQGNKQIVDVHNEARHLANIKSGKTGGGAPGSVEETAKAAGAAVSEKAQAVGEAVSDKAKAAGEAVSQKASEASAASTEKH